MSTHIKALKSFISLIIILISYYSQAQNARVRSNGIITDVAIQYYSLEKLGTNKKEFEMSFIDSIKFDFREERYQLLYKTLDEINVPYSFNIKPKEKLSDYDSLKQKIIAMDQAINNIHNNMIFAHNEYRQGVVLTFIGAAIGVIGVGINSTNKTS